MVRTSRERQERAAARCRKAYRRRVLRREMKRNEECLNKSEFIHDNNININVKPVHASTGVYSLRRKGGDECENDGESGTESKQTRAATDQDGINLSQ